MDAGFELLLHAHRRCAMEPSSSRLAVRLRSGDPSPPFPSAGLALRSPASCQAQPSSPSRRIPEQSRRSASPSPPLEPFSNRSSPWPRIQPPRRQLAVAQVRPESGGIQTGGTSPSLPRSRQRPDPASPSTASRLQALLTSQGPVFLAQFSESKGKAWPLASSKEFAPCFVRIPTPSQLVGLLSYNQEVLGSGFWVQLCPTRHRRGLARVGQSWWSLPQHNTKLVFWAMPTNVFFVCLLMHPSSGPSCSGPHRHTEVT